MSKINETRSGWMDPDHQNPNHEENQLKKYRKECMDFYNKWTDRFVVVNSDGKFLKVYKVGADLNDPESYTWIPGLKGTIPFKTTETAQSFIKKYSELPLYSSDIVKDDFIPSNTLSKEKIEIKKITEVEPYSI